MPKLAECLGNQESEKLMNATFDVISLLQRLFNMAGVNQQPPVHQFRMRQFKPFWGMNPNTSK
jgi:hypothetical protein